MIGRRDPLENPEELIRRVYAFVAYRLGDGPDAEDVTSETFARAVRYRDSYQRGKGEPIAWLIGIARHAIADHVGHAVVEVPAAEGVAASPGSRRRRGCRRSTSSRPSPRSSRATAS